METKTKLGINAGIVGALIFAGCYFNLVFLALAAGYAFLLEDNLLVKDAAKQSVILYLIYSALTLLFEFFEKLANLFGFYNSGVFYIFTDKFHTLVGIAYLIATVVFAIIALVKGLPQAHPAMSNGYQQFYRQTPQNAQMSQNTQMGYNAQMSQNTQMPVQANAMPKPCPTCGMMIQEPGFCPNCGTRVE